MLEQFFGCASASPLRLAFALRTGRRCEAIGPAKHRCRPTLSCSDGISLLRNGFPAAVETYDNGKPIRETNLTDMSLAVDHFRYFASCVRAQEGSIGQVDDDTVAYHFHEPLGVVAQIIPWNFPLLMAAWKLAPALARVTQLC